MSPGRTLFDEADAAAHLPLLPAYCRAGDWGDFLFLSLAEADLNRPRPHGRGGRVLAAAGFIAAWKAKLGHASQPD